MADSSESRNPHPRGGWGFQCAWGYTALLLITTSGGQGSTPFLRMDPARRGCLALPRPASALKTVHDDAGHQ